MKFGRWMRWLSMLTSSIISQILVSFSTTWTMICKDSSHQLIRGSEMTWDFTNKANSVVQISKRSEWSKKRISARKRSLRWVGTIRSRAHSVLESLSTNRDGLRKNLACCLIQTYYKINQIFMQWKKALKVIGRKEIKETGWMLMLTIFDYFSNKTVTNLNFIT